MVPALPPSGIVESSSVVIHRDLEHRGRGVAITLSPHPKQSKPETLL
ncbi:hypothetical protein [Rubinisphaera italica]|nr:hypothetical protein [Rubinisphaera italica]